MVVLVKRKVAAAVPAAVAVAELAKIAIIRTVTSVELTRADFQ